MYNCWQQDETKSPYCTASDWRVIKTYKSGWIWHVNFAIKESCDIKIVNDTDLWKSTTRGQECLKCLKNVSFSSVSALFNFCWHPLLARANERTSVPLFIWIAIVKNRSFMHIVQQSFPPRFWNKFRKFFLRFETHWKPPNGKKVLHIFHQIHFTPPNMV